MHSKIFQISNKPISEDEYCSPEDFYDNHGDFADYIGEEVTGQERKDCITYLKGMIKQVFRHTGHGVFEYRGKEALDEFKQEWLNELKMLTEKLTVDNLLEGLNLYNVSSATEKTHLQTNYRVKIDGWNGWAGPIADLFEWAESQLKEGDHIYVGAVIDYHY